MNAASDKDFARFVTIPPRSGGQSQPRRMERDQEHGPAAFDMEVISSREGGPGHSPPASALDETPWPPYHGTIPDSARSDMPEPTYEELKARLEELEKQQGPRRTGSLEFRVGEKGGVSVYGLGRFPVTLYYEQWIRLLDASEKLREFLEENKSKLKLKG